MTLVLRFLRGCEERERGEKNDMHMQETGKKELKTYERGEEREREREEGK